MSETRIRSLGHEDPLEKEMATHSGILAWKIPWMEEPGRLHGVAKSWTQLSNFTFFLVIYSFYYAVVSSFYAYFLENF